MKIEQKVNLHNKFEIEVKDSKSGKIKQRGKGYNIVTNYGLECMASASSTIFFKTIQFGSGTSQPLATRKSLYSALGYKTATLLEVLDDNSNGICSVKKKIHLGATEYIGATISEVGVGDSSLTTGLCTHSLLKDSEGNSLSILKTDSDEITIYATVYFKAASGPGFVVNSTDGFFKYAMGVPGNKYFWKKTNSMIFSSAKIQATRDAICPVVSLSIEGDDDFRTYLGSSSIMTVENKNTSRFICNLSAGEGNRVINTIGANNFTINVLDLPTWQGATIDVEVGTGDGITTDFNTPLSEIDGTSILNEAFIDGIKANCVFSDHQNVNSSIVNLVTGGWSTDESGHTVQSFLAGSLAYLNEGESIVLEFEKPVSISEIKARGAHSSGIEQLQVFHSNDGVSFTYHQTLGPIRSYVSLPLVTKTPFIKFLKLISLKRYIRPWISLISIIGDTQCEPQIKFATPPPAGSVITAKVFCKGIPKTQKHLLKLMVDLIYGDGGAI